MISAKRALLFFCMVSLFGCATQYRAYDGPQLSPDKVAIIKGAENFLPGTTTLGVVSIDGKSLSPYKTNVEILPGRHIIGVHYYFHAAGGLTARGDVVLDALPGKTYELQSKSEGKVVTFSIVEAPDKK